MQCILPKLSASIRRSLIVAAVAFACGLAFALSSCRTTAPAPPAPPASQSPTATDTAHDHSSHSHEHDTSKPKAAAAPGEKLCPVSGEVIEDPVIVQYQGKDVELCCKGCEKKFLANPTAYKTNS